MKIRKSDKDSSFYYDLTKVRNHRSWHNRCKQSDLSPCMKA